MKGMLKYEILEILQQHPEGMPVRELWLVMRVHSRATIDQTLRHMLAEGLVRREKRIVWTEGMYKTRQNSYWYTVKE